MNRTGKNVAALALSLTLALAPLSTQALAVSQNAPAPQQTAAYLAEPRFTYISRISCGMTISEDGYASGTGSCTIYKDMGVDCTITVTLQYFKGGKWVTFGSDSKDFTGDGMKLFQQGWDVTSGYTYKCVTKVEITDADGTVVETVTADSPTKYY